jgi:radical SAM superfamily enzyme YgiQ (UPF0313 family)
MQILLLAIDAKYIHTNNAVRLIQANSSFPIDKMEFTIKDDLNQIKESIESIQPDVLGLSVYIWNVDIVISLLEMISLPNTTIVLGGPEVSYEPEYFLKNTNASYIIRGEGELVFDQLLTHIKDGTRPVDCNNIAWLDNGNVVLKPIEEIADLSTIKEPYYQEDDIKHIPHKISYIESSRGCPYNCSYCLSSLEKKVRFFPIQTVLDAITYLMNHGSKTIKFLDRTFNANTHSLTIIDHIIKQDNQQTVFQFEITGDILPMSLIDYIHSNARPGLFRFEIGIQSTNEETNILVDRHQNTPALFERIKRIQEHGIIDLHLDLIAGLPKEDKTSFIKTFNEVYQLGASELQLGFLKLLRGTKIRTQALKYGYIFDQTAPYELLSNDVLSEEDISEIKLVEHMLEIYHNKGYFGTNLHNIIVKHKSPYHFFLTIGTHYNNNNYPLHGYQIKDVYRHLIELLNDQETYLILQDYLLRSKIKPERFFDMTMSKSVRKTILEKVSDISSIPIHLLYKHSVLLQYQDEFFCAYYNQQHCYSYKGKVPNK